MIFSLPTSGLENWFRVVQERDGASATAADVRMYTQPLLSTVRLSYSHSFLQLGLKRMFPVYCWSLLRSFSLVVFLPQHHHSCSWSVFTTPFLSFFLFYWLFLLLVFSCNECSHATSLYIQLIPTIHLFVFVVVSETYSSQDLTSMIHVIDLADCHICPSNPSRANICHRTRVQLRVSSGPVSNYLYTDGAQAFIVADL